VYLINHTSHLEENVARIKSALELALEKTADVQGDPKSVKAYERKQEGKRLVSRMTEDKEFDLKKELKKYPPEEQNWIKEGFYEVIVSHLSLPANEEELERVRFLKRGLDEIIKDRKGLDYLFEQVEQIFNQYLQNRQQLIESLRQQFSGRLRQREEEMSRQLGRQIHLDPASDPEFSNALQQNLNRLQERYGDVIDQVRTELGHMFEKSV